MRRKKRTKKSSAICWRATLTISVKKTKNATNKKVERKAVTSTASAKEMLSKADSNRGVLIQLEYPPRLGGGGASKVLKPAMANK